MTDEAAALCTGSDPGGGVTQQPTQQSEPVHVKTLFSKGFCAVHESFDGVLQCADSGLHCDPTV